MAYKQSITDMPTITVTAGYPAYPDGTAHRGIDTVHGDHKAFAPASGTVVVAQVWDGHTITGDQSWGNMIKVQMADGSTWRAAHFASQLWHVGDTITKGDFIGTQGETGNATGIHTHWEYATAGGALLDPSGIIGIPNARGVYNVEWDASVDPGPGPDPDPDPDPDPGPVNTGFTGEYLYIAGDIPAYGRYPYYYSINPDKIAPNGLGVGRKYPIYSEPVTREDGRKWVIVMDTDGTFVYTFIDTAYSALKNKLPIWLLFKMAKRGRLL